MQAALLFEPDGYVLDGPKLMGRQSAGHGFLRAAVAGREGDPVIAYSQTQAAFETFRQLVEKFDPAAPALWIPTDRTDRVAETGLLFRPDHAINVSARARLYRGMAAYSLCGQTHTLSTEASFQHLFDLSAAPVAPWDAVICTSSAAREVFRAAYARHADYLVWKLGTKVADPAIQLPIIPLGIHTADFAAGAHGRPNARQRFGIADDEVVALFAGRLSFNAKAHPIPMYRGLQAAAERTGRKLVLIEAGSYPNEQVGALFEEARARHMPAIRSIVVAGRDFAAYGATWHAADLFLCLSDSIQETFGLTPVEAMAAGLPVLVSDWNGYKDTVRDGVDGFRIRSWAPAVGSGEAYAHDHAAGASNLDMYLAVCGGAVALDNAQLVDRLSDLVDNPELRQRLGASGRVRAWAEYDWAKIFARYRALWSELAEIRATYAAKPDWIARIAAAPHCHPVFPDPFAAFAHYPTAAVCADTLITIEPGVSMTDYAALAQEPLNRLGNPAPQTVAAFFAALATAPGTVGGIAARSGIAVKEIEIAAVRMAKLGLIRLG